MPRYDRLSILVSLVLLGLMLSHLVELPTRTITFMALGVPTTVYLAGRWAVGALLVVMTGAGADSIARSHPDANAAGWAYGLTFWGIPCAVVLLALVALPLSPTLPFWLGGLALTGLVLTLVAVAQYATIGGRGRPGALASWGLSMVAYAAVFIFCTFIYAAHVRSLLSASAIFGLGSALAAGLLRPNAPQFPVKRIWAYSVLIGLVLGEVAWALNHLSLGEVASGVFFLLVFYVTSGLARLHLNARLAPSVIVEFVAVSVLGLGLIYIL
jgi:hypothetical protein